MCLVITRFWGEPHPLIEIEAAKVGAVGDKHHLMAAAIGENNKVPRLGGALQADLLLGGRQLVDLLLEGEGVRIHRVLHGKTYTDTHLKASCQHPDLRRPSDTCPPFNLTGKLGVFLL